MNGFDLTTARRTQRLLRLLRLELPDEAPEGRQPRAGAQHDDGRGAALRQPKAAGARGDPQLLIPGGPAESGARVRGSYTTRLGNPGRLVIWYPPKRQV